MKLEVMNVEKSFDDKHVLKDVSFSFEQGKIYGILGRNGAGKTTLFHCICGNLEVDSGTCFILREDGRKQEIKYHDIGMVSATPVLPEFLTGYEFIKFYMEVNEMEYSKEIMDHYFEMIRLSKEDQHRLIKEYSYGMKNKLQLLCCLIAKPPVILLDEPLTSLDIIVSHDIKELIIQMKSEHIIIMSTHILQLAKDVCNEIIILDQGTLNRTNFGEMDYKDFELGIIKALQDIQ